MDYFNDGDVVESMHFCHKALDLSSWEMFFIEDALLVSDGVNLFTKILSVR